MVLDTGGVMEPLDFAPSDAQELISVIVKTISGLGLSSVSSDTFVSLCFAKVTLSNHILTKTQTGTGNIEYNKVIQ